MSQHVAALTPGHLVSLVEPTLQPPTPVGFDAARHLRVAVHDIVEAEDGHILPDVAHVEELIRFVRGWRGEQALLVHCVAGISRSTAAALIALAVSRPGDEHRAAARLRRAAPHAHPNRRLIALADKLLNADGRLIAARDAMGPAVTLSCQGPLVVLPLNDRDSVSRIRYK